VDQSDVGVERARRVVILVAIERRRTDAVDRLPIGFEPIGGHFHGLAHPFGCVGAVVGFVEEEIDNPLDDFECRFVVAPLVGKDVIDVVE